MIQDLEILHGKKCPYCNAYPKLVDSSVVYGTSYGFIWLCQPCRAYVGTHKYDNKTPLGRLANAELREWKKKAHAAFDPIWQAMMRDGQTKKHNARNAAYDWLSVELGIGREFTHIGMFDVEECKKTIEAVYKMIEAINASGSLCSK